MHAVCLIQNSDSDFNSSFLNSKPFEVIELNFYSTCIPLFVLVIAMLWCFVSTF